MRKNGPPYFSEETWTGHRKLICCSSNDSCSGGVFFTRTMSDLVTEFIKYPGETGEMRAFMADPKTGKKFPAVIVIHENRGLVPHIQDVTRRMAKEGFLCTCS